MRRLITALLLAAVVPASTFAATEVAGVKFEEKARVGAGETVLNGAGMRNRAFFKVYAMGLYLPQKASHVADALGGKGAKRVAIVTLRDLTAEQFADALVDGLKKNHDEAALAPLQPKIEQFRTIMLGIGNAAEKTTVFIDWLPDVGGGVTRLTVNGAVKGADIGGEDFYRGLLRVWLGEKPAQDDLKEKLLGKS